MLLPHALAGIATVALVYLTVKRWYGARWFDYRNRNGDDAGGSTDVSFQ